MSKKKNLVEGFKLINHSNHYGFVLYCTFEKEGTDGFIVNIKEALASLDEKRKEYGQGVRRKGIRYHQPGNKR